MRALIIALMLFSVTQAHAINFGQGAGARIAAAYHLTKQQGHRPVVKRINVGSYTRSVNEYTKTAHVENGYRR